MADVQIKSVPKLLTLLLLNEKERCGYELMKELESRMGAKPNPGQMYPFLKLLEGEHYIQARGREARDKQVYFITKEGKKYVNRVLYDFRDVIMMAMKPQLAVCARCGREVLEVAGH